MAKLKTCSVCGERVPSVIIGIDGRCQRCLELNEVKIPSKTEQFVSDEIENYILYFTSDEEERKEMLQVRDDYMREIYEDSD